jgi:hypothetical protein
MVDDALILRVERLASSLQELRRSLRDSYERESQVNSTSLRYEARRVAETWMVEVAPFPEVKQTLGNVVGDLNIQLTRLLTYSERRSLRRLYDVAIAAILRDFNARVLIPLKQARDLPAVTIGPSVGRAFGSVRSAFVGHSFSPSDKDLVSTVVRLIEAFDIRVETGERPSADSVSAKVKRRIDRSDAFVGVFTRREKLSGREAYTTSAWIIDEKAYAVARDKKLVLLKDALVESIGGMQGDYEYLPFDPADVLDLAVRLVELLAERE